ncbi:hypothetical protein [Agromyces sp. NBRC 114283]|uniref:DUF7507 domain-containing protein n=1 Tax=Agromyces sp. NBRC 114283 TaxID=2994521 RepID=UPI0025571362|nr:hypothetical protein [Agromyces sp. NBRC 114283]
MAKQTTQRRTAGLRRVLAALGIGALVAGAAAVVPTSAANAAEPFSAEYLYGQGVASTGQPVSRAIYQIDATTGATTQILTAPPSTSSFNSLALTADGNAMLMTNTTTVFMYDAPSESWRQAARPSNDAASNFMGGVNSVTGYFYYGGNRWAGAPSDTFVFAAYDLANNTVIPNALTVTAAGNTGWNGDLVFDQQGNMFILSSDATGANPEGSVVYRVNASDVSTQTGGTATATAVGPKIMGTQYANGTAYGPDGYGYISRNDDNQSGPSTLLRTDPVSFSLVGTVALNPPVRLVDLASRVFHPTALVNVDLPQGRHSDTDQFHLSYQGPEPGDPLLEAETTGTESGLQDQEAGEYIGRTATFPGDTYTFSQSAAGTTNFGNYRTTWACVNLESGETVSSGTGNSGSFTVPVAPIIDVDCTFTNIPLKPGLTLEKSADRTELVAGQTITYSFLVTNTGDVALEVAVNEISFTGSGELSDVSCPRTSLAPTEAVTCTATYEVTQADVDRGSVDNSASVTGTPPNGGDPVTSDPDSVRVPGVPAPGLSIVKSADTDELVVGETITYEFVVTNTGNVTLTEIVVNEGAFTGSGELSAVDCPVTVLAPDRQVTCTATYEVTQADVDQGSIENSATATGTPPNGGDPVTSEPDEVEIPQDAAPGITIEKSASPESTGAAGDEITYTFRVTNTGNVTLTDASVTEGDFSGTGELGPIVCPDGAASLSPGEFVDCTAGYTLTQADVDAGGVTNSATASGTPPNSGDPVTSEPDDARVDIPPAPELSIEKSADTDELVVGETITYEFVVTNTGNVTLTEIVVNEGTFTGSGELSAVDCPVTVLAPDRQVTCTATYEVTQADVDQASIENSASATGTPPNGGDPVTSEPDDANVPSERNPGIELMKSVSPAEGGAAGDEIVYTFTVRNTGNVTLTEVTIDEGDFSGTGPLGPIVCPDAALAPNRALECTASYVLTQADVDAGGVTNSATATATPPDGTTPPVSPPSSAELPIPPAPGLSIEKSADRAELIVGETITYSFVVTNTGNVTLADVTVEEGDFSGSGELSAVSCPAEAASLAPGDRVTCTATYEVTQADVDRGSIENSATANGVPPAGGDPVGSEPGEARVPQDPAPGLSLVKSADAERAERPGQLITYSFTISNIGNVTVSDIVVSDDDFSGAGELSAIECPTDPLSLAPGETAVCTATYDVRPGDLDGRPLMNTASASGTGPGGTPVTSASSTVAVPTSAQASPVPGPGQLSRTGIELGAGILLLVALLLSVGAGTIVVARRKRVDG